MKLLLLCLVALLPYCNAAATDLEALERLLEERIESLQRAEEENADPEKSTESESFEDLREFDISASVEIEDDSDGDAAVMEKEQQDDIKRVFKVTKAEKSTESASFEDLRALEFDISASVEIEEDGDGDAAVMEKEQQEDIKRAENTEREVSTDTTDVEMRRIVTSLARYAMQQQLYIEEMTRSTGDSGLKQVRHNREGTRNYHSDNHMGHSHSSIHDHANNIRTIGMGEVIGVLNGVEFRTRHNDYGLRQPHRWKKVFQETSDIPFPGVPKRVTDKTSVADQIAEMRQWFEAFKNQENKGGRQYKYFFKPVLCYMEGMWTHTDESLDESFESDRHFIDASSWEELENKIRFLSYSGGKDQFENLAFLPRAVFNVTEKGYPVYVQWNYDILCHPLKDDLPLDRLRMVDDLSGRMRRNTRVYDYKNNRMARFQLNTEDAPWDGENNNRHVLLDSLMYQIPGKDNYKGFIEDKGLGDSKFRLAENRTAILNAAFYHHSYQALGNDAMGLQRRFRGYADENLYMAQTTMDKVAGMTFNSCKRGVCREVTQKWTYAIPLEIIYLTPLYRWNPYNITYKGERGDPDYDSVTANGRNGQLGSAYDGTNSKNFYQTPFEFYSGQEVDVDTADTTPSGSVVVLDSSGKERLTAASGTRIFLPDIQDVGKVRTRYPIAPIHGEGSAVWKELNALKELVLNPAGTGHLIYNPLTAGGGVVGGGTSSLLMTYELRESSANFQNHQHQITLTSNQVTQLQAGQNITVGTTQTNAHTHTLVLYAVDGRMSEVRYRSCDGNRWCFDSHPSRLDEVGNA